MRNRSLRRLTMNPLQSLQSDFQSFLLRGDEAMFARVTGTAKVSAQQRLAVYYDAYRLRLLEALDANYPVLHTWIGDEEFEQLGLAYLDAHPSRHFSIRYFGHRLPEFLTTEPYCDRRYLSEMAALEWALSEAFDAADDVLVNIEDMARHPAGGLAGHALQFPHLGASPESALERANYLEGRQSESGDQERYGFLPG